MENAEEILQALEEFSKLKPKEIPKELEDYLGYVAKSGDPVYQWNLVKHLFHEKLSSVITDFYETSPTIDIPPCPNVDPFNYERMKSNLIERLDSFSSAPFTIQRICELLTNPRKQYNRVDKFMRAIEKNILVVSTREPGAGKRLENDQTEAVLNGIPDNKISENDDRDVNICSENVHFNESNDIPQVPVENAVNACVIQEEIEIANTASAAMPESKDWCDSNNENGVKQESEIDSKTNSIIENTEIHEVSTSSITNTELPKSNIVYPENDSEINNIKLESDNVEEMANDNIICNEPIVSSTPDSPEPSNLEERCEPSREDKDLPVLTAGSSVSDSSDIGECELNNEKSIEQLQQPTDNQILPEVVGVDDKLIQVTERNNETTESQTTSSCNRETTDLSNDGVINTSSELSAVQPQQEEERDISDLKIEQLSPENNQPDSSSNDSFQNGGNDNSLESIVKCESIPNEDFASINSESSEQISNELNDVTSSEESITIKEEEVNEAEDDESNNADLIVKVEPAEDDEPVEEFQKIAEPPEVIKDAIVIVEENVTPVTNEGDVGSSEECVSIEEITGTDDIKDIEDNSNAETEIVESSTELLDELCDLERTEGSVIHVTPSVSEMGPSVGIVEDICVDQSSCSADIDEAMDVDETSNQQMIMSEGENEGEPMDQSEHLQS